MKNIGLVSAVILLALVGCSVNHWSPPKNPNPIEILSEARSDREDDRFEAALAKHIWFHENALKYQPSLSGVRLSFALSDWLRLANRFPPALERLEQIRDKSKRSVQTNTDDFDAFHDFTSINRVLKNEDQTVSLFKWIEENNPSFSASAYIVAQDSLVAAEEYALCGKYIGATDSYYDYEYDFRRRLRATDKSSRGDEAIEFARRMYTYRVALLIAILVKNNQSAEASAIADRALLDWEQDLDSEKILGAKKGIIPERLY